MSVSQRAARGLAILLLCQNPFVMTAVVAQDALSSGRQSADRSAWETLSQLVAPSRALGRASIVFGTWASDDDVYRSTPPAWPQRSGRNPTRPGAMASQGTLAPVSGQSGCVPPHAPEAGHFPAGACILEEIRYNQASVRYIIDNHLFSRSGLASFAQHDRSVDFPADAIAIKADWVKAGRIEQWLGRRMDLAEIKQAYYTKTIDDGLNPVEYALVALHISTKQRKNWIWSDFENERNPGRCDDIGCHDGFGALIADVKPQQAGQSKVSDAAGSQDYGSCRKSPAAEALLETIGAAPAWRHYCLKGTQVDFVNEDKSNSLLGNSVIERINSNVPVARSSCISCHAYAAFDKHGVTAALPNRPVGPVDPKSRAGLTQNDFMWGILKDQ